MLVMQVLQAQQNLRDPSLDLGFGDFLHFPPVLVDHFEQIATLSEVHHNAQGVAIHVTFPIGNDVRVLQRCKHLRVMSSSLDRPNFGGLVLGCVEAKFCKKICV